MKSFKQFIKETHSSKIKSHKTVEQIAKKHRLSVSFIQKQLDMGEPIEHEHTKDHTLAMDITLQHLDEIPDYYTRLKKMESSAKKEHKKFKDVKEEKGEIRYCNLCKKEESKEECKYGPVMWSMYTGSNKILSQNQIKYNTTRPHPANESVTIEDADGNTFLEVIDLIKPERMKGISEGRKSGDYSLHDWFSKSKSKNGKPGWVQLGGKYAGEPCARQPGQTTKPKCGSSKMSGEMSPEEEERAAARKRKEDPNPDRKGKAINVATEEYVEEDACKTKVKSRYKVWPSAYACVPIETSKALTKEGWKSYDQLNIGDQILTFNLEQNNLEFKPIQNLHYYTDTPTYVVKNGNTGWKFECTPNHKWVVKYPECKGNRGRKKYTNLINNMQLVSIEEILNESGKNRKLIISSKYNEGTPISLDKIYKYGTNWVEYLFNCSAEQRESWLYSAIVYDGNQIKTERLTEKKEDQSDCEYVYDTPYNKQSFGFKQKDINHRDAFLLSAFLNGGLVTFRKNTKTNIYSCHYVSYDGTKSLEGFKLIENKKSNVWCPQTENGTWVMMQETDGNGVITITGNSGALVKCRKVGAANWGNKKNNVDESYLRIQTRGSTYTILLNWRGKYITTQMFFQQFTRPTKEEVTREIRKVYPNAIVLSFNPSVKDPTKPLLFTGEPNGTKNY